MAILGHQSLPPTDLGRVDEEMATSGRGYHKVPCTRDSAHKTFGPTDLTSTYSMCTRRVFGGIGHRTQAFRSGIRCSNH
ncbi:hypothetical protein TNCV_1676071 [Trichonephila clavipes]|nr:hypothetical protein TNCV_1676071 [Trichonephila clavipes]